MKQRSKDSRGSVVSEYAALTMAAVTFVFSLVAVITLKPIGGPITAGIRSFEAIIWPIIQWLIDLVQKR